MSMAIETLGYRWRGIYSPYLAYQERDVVFKDGGAYVIRGSTPQPFALGQQDVILKGHLLTGGVSVGGNAGMILHSNGQAGMEFRFMQERNGTIAIKLMDTLNCGSYTASGYYMLAIMNGGDVRGWGNASGGRLGCGAGDYARVKPARVAFPPGSPRIVSVKSNWADTFYIDENGGLWHSGPNSENASGTNSQNFIPRKLNGFGDLATSTRVVKVFTGYDYYGSQHQGCIDSNGLVYMWGLNQYGCCGWGDTIGSIYPKVVPLSVRYPIKDAFVSGGTYTATYLIDIYGRLWTAGQGGSSGQNYDQPFHTLFMPWGEDKPVKSVRTCETDAHWVAGAQYYRRFCVVLENGSLYMWGDDSGQTNGGWGTGYTGDIWTGSSLFPYKCLDGVLDAFTISGGYSRSVALMQDGTVKATGYSGYNFNGKSADTTTWQTIGAGYLEGVVKLRCYGAMYGATAMALRSDGRAVGWGCGANGTVGNGLGASGNLPNSFVMLDRKIVDFSTSGYCSAGDDIVMAHHFLTTDGRVYTTGAASNYMNGDTLGNARNTPSQIIF